MSNSTEVHEILMNVCMNELALKDSFNIIPDPERNCMIEYDNKVNNWIKSALTNEEYAIIYDYYFKNYDIYKLQKVHRKYGFIEDSLNHIRIKLASLTTEKLPNTMF